MGGGGVVGVVGVVGGGVGGVVGGGGIGGGGGVSVVGGGHGERGGGQSVGRNVCLLPTPHETVAAAATLLGHPCRQSPSPSSASAHSRCVEVVAGGSGGSGGSGGGHGGIRARHKRVVERRRCGGGWQVWQRTQRSFHGLGWCCWAGCGVGFLEVFKKFLFLRTVGYQRSLLGDVGFQFKRRQMFRGGRNDV